MFDQQETFFDCPYCGERISVLVDMSVETQTYIEDCEVCCQPLSLRCEVHGEALEFSADRCD